MITGIQSAPGIPTHNTMPYPGRGGIGCERWYLGGTAGAPHVGADVTDESLAHHAPWARASGIGHRHHTYASAHAWARDEDGDGDGDGDGDAHHADGDGDGHLG